MPQREKEHDENDDPGTYRPLAPRDTPVPAPPLSPEEWQGFLDQLLRHGVYPTLVYRLRSRPETCRPPRDVMDWLNRFTLGAAARTMRAGRRIQAVVDALAAAGIPPVLLKGPAPARTAYPSMSGSSTDSGATMTAATNRECPPDRFRQTGKNRRSPPARVGGLL